MMGSRGKRPAPKFVPLFGELGVPTSTFADCPWLVHVKTRVLKAALKLGCSMVMS